MTQTATSNPRRPILFKIEHPIPDGYEAIAFRAPKDGEQYLTHDGKSVANSVTGAEYQAPRLILQKIWVWPSWLKCRVITRDADGRIDLWNDEPTCNTVKNWVPSEGGKAPIYVMVGRFLDLDLPTLPPEQSIWRNPCFQSTKS